MANPFDKLPAVVACGGPKNFGGKIMELCEIREEWQFTSFYADKGFEDTLAKITFLRKEMGFYLPAMVEIGRTRSV